MNVLVNPHQSLMAYLGNNARFYTDGESSWCHVEGLFRLDQETGYLVKVDPLDVPDEVVEGLKLDSVL
jgi:hypothetical protein